MCELTHGMAGERHGHTACYVSIHLKSHVAFLRGRAEGCRSCYVIVRLHILFKISMSLRICYTFNGKNDVYY